MKLDLSFETCHSIAERTLVCLKRKSNTLESFVRVMAIGMLLVNYRSQLGKKEIFEGKLTLKM